MQLTQAEPLASGPVIPTRIIRSVPADTSSEVEAFWDRVTFLHPGWEMVTYRDPIDPTVFPITSPVWPLAKTGAQLAGLIRLEALWATGGIWLDSDVELFRPLTPLLHCSLFAAYEDPAVIPDAVLGATVAHPAIGDCLAEALRRIRSDSTDWRTGNGAWSTGPGVTTSILPMFPDALLLPPGCFYPVHYSEKHTIGRHQPAPWEFGLHHWAGSWL